MFTNNELSTNSAHHSTFLWCKTVFDFLQKVVIFYAFSTGIFSIIHTYLSDCYHKRFIGAIMAVGCVHVFVSIIVLLHAKSLDNGESPCINFHKWSLCCLTIMLMLCLQKIMQHWYPKKVFLQWLLVIYTCCCLFVLCWSYQDIKDENPVVLNIPQTFQLLLTTCKEDINYASLSCVLEYGLIYVPYISTLGILIILKKGIFGKESNFNILCCSNTEERKKCCICINQDSTINVAIGFLAFSLLFVRPIYLIYFSFQNIIVSDIIPCMGTVTVSLMFSSIHLKSYILNKQMQVEVIKK